VTAPNALDEYPRQIARTRGFTLGVPRTFEVSPDGGRVAFLRTRAGDDPVSCLWVLDVASGKERCVFDPAAEEDESDLTAAERARRERARERSSGVTAYATDEAVRLAVFALAGRLVLVDLLEGAARELPAGGPVDDPRLDPTGRRIAYVVEGALHVRDLDGSERVLAADDEPDVTWGLAEFAAAEEMGRDRGHWWSPDGRTLAAARVDERRVRTWYLSDPTDPAAPPRAVRYPQAGTEDAIVSLHLFDVGTGERTDVVWDAAAFPLLGRVHWSAGGPPVLEVVSRDQRRAQLLEVDPGTGATTVLGELEDPEWVDLVFETPGRLSDGSLVTVEADRATDTYRLAIDGGFVTPPGVQVRGVPRVGDEVLFVASEDPTEVHLWRLVPGEEPLRLTDGAGVHAGTASGGTTVVVSATLDDPLPRATVRRADGTSFDVRRVAEPPVLEPRPRLFTLGERELRAALLLPGGREPDRPLPVLMDPYGGPHGARVLASAGMYLTSQWLADQGFAVLVVDGRGVDGRGPAWDRAVRFDLAVTVEDQVDALVAAAETLGFLDLSRVGIRGWSFGGTLAALAVLRRPDVFHAAVVGAPVTDWRLYDTTYTERYLGHPDEHPEAYARSSPLSEAHALERPMLLIHGLADDNVYVAHTLRLSAELFEAGRSHELVLIPSATHLTRRAAVTEQLLRVQARFLRRTLLT
jgi:dipeptidyl-peptidase-4